MLSRQTFFAFLICFAGVVLLTIPETARAQIFALNNDGSVGAYATTGATENNALVTGISTPIGGIAAFGTNLFIAHGYDTISEYTTAGILVNDTLITGLFNPTGIAISDDGANLFVTNYFTDTIHNGFTGIIGKYSTTGETLNDSLVLGLYGPTGIAVSGSVIFVSNYNNGINSGTIGEYATDGSVINDTLVSGLQGPWGIAVSGTNLFVANMFSGTIGEYTTSGATVNASLITGLNGPAGLAVSGTNLFVSSVGDGTIAEYTTSGEIVNTSLITGLNGPISVAVVPEPSSWAFFAIGTTALLFIRNRKTLSIAPDLTLPEATGDGIRVG